MVGKPRRNPVTDKQIIDHYKESNSVFKTEEALGIGSTTIYRVLLKNDIPRNGLEIWRRSATKFRGQEREIRKAYDAGATYEQLAKRYGESSKYALKQALKRSGATLRENPAQLIKVGELNKIRKLNADGYGQMQISLAIGRSQSFVGRVMRKNGIPTRGGAGSKHTSWKGGRYKDGSGYIRAWVSKDDPMAVMAHNDSHVLEHRLVMARKLKRPLLRTETVHHINGDRTDNRPKNLQLRQGKHGKHVVMCCLDCGSRNIGHAKLEH